MIAQRLQQPVAFGERYWLTEMLAVGGMAEIYLARQNAMAGFEKEIVIKRLKPELAGDRAIQQMFLDEARIGAVLNHPNIVHVYDVDEQDGIPYIAMEYIRGEELNHLCRRGLQLGKFLPLQHAVELLRQAAEGMGYFHAKRDGEARNLDIVHCDISPTNLLITEDGFLKIIDFGIARARTQRFRHDNAIPGKLSYMSPEQAARGSVDWRSDIFSLGIVLYEITVGQRLFRGPAHEVVQRLIKGDIRPPTFIRRSFPGPLEAIIMRSLEHHPQDRYQSAYDLADDLEMFLREAKLRSSPVRIARYLDELSVAAGGQRRAELVSEAEQVHHDEDDLDFDRGSFDGHAGQADVSGAEVTDWDEYEESEGEMAAALGIDPALLDPITRTPVPRRDYPLEATGDSLDAPTDAELPAVAPRGDAGAADDDDEPPTGSFAPVADKPATKPKTTKDPGTKRIADAPAVATKQERSEGRASSAEKKKPAQKAAPQTPAAAKTPTRPDPGEVPGVNWLVVGGAAGVALTATLLYLLLS